MNEQQPTNEQFRAAASKLLNDKVGDVFPCQEESDDKGAWVLVNIWIPNKDALEVE